MGFWKTFLASATATVVGGIILLHLGQIKEWITNSIGLIIYYSASLVLGIAIGYAITLIKRNFTKICAWIANVGKCVFKIACCICKWFRIIFTLNKFDTKVNSLEKEIAELKKEKNKDFLRIEYYFSDSLALDDQTKNIFNNLKKEKGTEKAIPYLYEFYKRILELNSSEWWSGLSYEQKKAEFQKIINLIDSGWGEKLL
jgi:hypothetical protein